MYARLPASVQEQTRAACLLFNENPRHPSLRWHELANTGQGRHLPRSVSVSITIRYRAIYIVGEDGRNVWYWIGTHAEYDHFTGG